LSAPPESQADVFRVGQVPVLRKFLNTEVLPDCKESRITHLLAIEQLGEAVFGRLPAAEDTKVRPFSGIRRTNMKPAIRTTFLIASVTVFAFVARGKQILPSPIPRSASVFIDPMDGFGPELQEALLNNDVPLVIVSNKDDADFEITGGIRDAKERPINGRTASDEQEAGTETLRTHVVMVSIVNLKTKSVAWGYGVTGVPDLANAADSCAKHLKEEMKRKQRKH
jgi:hypothetical protein